MSENTVKKVTADELSEFCLKCAEDKLAQNTVRINVGPQSSVADWFVVCTANSEPQLRALVSFIERQVRDVYKLRPLSQNGETSSGWVLIDFGSVVVHIMTAETRDRYNLEGLWGETPNPEAVRTIADHQ